MASIKDLKAPRNVDHSDSLGGFVPISCGAHPATVISNHMRETKAGNPMLVAEFELEDKRKYVQMFFLTNSEGQVTYKDENGKQKTAQGYIKADALAVIAGVDSLVDLEESSGTFKIKDESGKEVQRKLPMYPELNGLEVILGIVSRERYKREKIGDDYVETDNITVETEVHTFFDAEGFTANELLSDAEEPSFIDDFEKQYNSETPVIPLSAAAIKRHQAAANTTKRSGSTSKRSLSGNNEKRRLAR